MKERNLTCIVCPRGCALRVTLDDSGKPQDIEGNACKRGKTYAVDECTHPRRTVTTTVRREGGMLLPVKTSGTVPKELVFEIIKEINAYTAPKDASLGDVLIENVLGTGVNVVVTGSVSK